VNLFRTEEMQHFLAITLGELRDVIVNDSKISEDIRQCPGTGMNLLTPETGNTVKGRTIFP
jgi:hypothetical protein